MVGQPLLSLKRERHKDLYLHLICLTATDLGDKPGGGTDAGAPAEKLPLSH